MVPRCFRSRQRHASLSRSNLDFWSRASVLKAREWRLYCDSVMAKCGRGANVMASTWTVAVTREIPDAGLQPLQESTTVKLWDKEMPPNPEELDALLAGCDG